MRKYRGLTKEGKWVYGGLIKHGFREQYRIVTQEDAIFVKYEDMLQVMSYEVLPETVGQATGLKDKNGKAIYEGDIVEFNSFGLKPEQAVIKFQVHCYNAGFYPNKSANASHYWKIIGTIHENPELLNEKTTKQTDTS